MVTMRPLKRRPAALGANAVAHGLVIGPEPVTGPRVGLRDITVRVQADGARWLTELCVGAIIEIDMGQTPRRPPADNSQHQREVVTRGADDRFRAAADADPDFERPCFE